MCYRTAAAQQLERSRVLNSGIVILLMPPILVLAGILLLAFRKSRQSISADDEIVADAGHQAEIRTCKVCEANGVF